MKCAENTMELDKTIKNWLKMKKAADDLSSNS